jgi:hypothetical protein
MNLISLSPSVFGFGARFRTVSNRWKLGST